MLIALWRKHVLRQFVRAKGTLSILECWYRDLSVEDTLGGIYGKYCIPLTMPKNVHIVRDIVVYLQELEPVSYPVSDHMFLGISQS